MYVQSGPGPPQAGYRYLRGYSIGQRWMGRRTTSFAHPPPPRRNRRERPSAARRVANDEPELLQLIADVLALGDEVTWGIDLADGGAALAITPLLNHDQPVLYLSGRAIHRASEGYRGEGKTDAKDAAVIADQARIRRDLHPLRAGDETVTELKILTDRRTDLVADALAPSTGSALNSLASFPVWSVRSTSPTPARSSC